MTDPIRGESFRYLDHVIDERLGRLTCRYLVDGEEYAEQVTFPAGGDWHRPAVRRAARWVFLLAGVSYYKTTAAPVIDVTGHDVTDAEAAFLRDYYLHGLGEFAYENDLDLDDIVVEGAGAAPLPPLDPVDAGRGPLIPFGGGIDSIVTVELVRARENPVLFIVSRPNAPFEAIETAAAATGLPIVRAERELDPKVLTSRPGRFNGHVPITAIISAVAVLAAALDGRREVVMSNEWSASSATIDLAGRSINHQYSKSYEFEGAFREHVSSPVGIDWFSMLRPYTELLIARRFAELERYHGAFRSCNRAFAINPADRLDHWCGVCDKCCFIDLILSPFVPRAELEAIFDGKEPLADEALRGRFDALLELGDGAPKPFECVGDVVECRVAAVMAAEREDRQDQPTVQVLAADVRRAAPALVSPAELLRPVGPHFIPARHATDDLLV